LISRVRGQMEESSKKRSLELRDFSFSVGRASHQGKVGQPSFSSFPRDQGSTCTNSGVNSIEQSDSTGIRNRVMKPVYVHERFSQILVLTFKWSFASARSDHATYPCQSDFSLRIFSEHLVQRPRILSSIEQKKKH